MLSLPKELNNFSKEDPVDGKEYYHPMVEEWDQRIHDMADQLSW